MVLRMVIEGLNFSETFELPQVLFSLVLGLYLALFRGYSLLCAEGLLLVVLKGPHVVPETELGSAACKI